MGCIHAAAKRQLFQVALVLHLDIFFSVAYDPCYVTDSVQHTDLYSFVNNEDY
jgi:hypothetical protein